MDIRTTATSLSRSHDFSARMTSSRGALLRFRVWSKTFVTVSAGTACCSHDTIAPKHQVLQKLDRDTTDTHHTTTHYTLHTTQHTHAHKPRNARFLRQNECNTIVR